MHLAYIFLALLVFTQSYCCHAGVRPSSLSLSIQVLRNCYFNPGQILWVYLSTISADGFFVHNFQFSKFYDFFFVFVNMLPHIHKSVKTLLLPQFPISINVCDNYVIGEYRLLICAICTKLIQKIKSLIYRYHRTTWDWYFQSATTPTVFIWPQQNFMMTKTIKSNLTKGCSSNTGLAF